MTLRTKFLIISWAGIALLLLPMLLFAGSWGREHLEQAAAQRGQNLANSLARSTAEQAIVGNYTQTQSVLNRIAESPGVVYASVLDENGDVMAIAFGEGNRERSLVEPGGAGTLSELGDVLEVSSEQSMYGRVWGSVRIGIALDDVHAAIGALYRLIVKLGLIAFAIGAFAATIFGRIINPLQKVVLGAEQFAGGDLSTRVALDRPDEIGRLAASFDGMAESIEIQFHEIERGKRELQLTYDVLEQLASTIEKDVLLERLIEASTKALDATGCTVRALHARRGFVEVFETGDDGVQYSVLQPGDVGLQSFDDTNSLAALLAEQANVREDAQTVISTITAGGRELGILSLTRREESPFNEVDRGLVAGIARHLAVALENARLYEMAIHDGLTELYIKRYFIERLGEEIERARRYKKPIGVVMADLDHFKRVNDERGHLTGDRVLKGLADLLKATVRSSDVVCRFGGEEIAIMLPEQTLGSAMLVGEKIRAVVENHAFDVADGGAPLHVTLSIGVAVFPDHGDDPEALIGRADIALYEAKRAGRNRVVAARS
jgi:diguanylate cyclase (GGDEF)-like protein